MIGLRQETIADINAIQAIYAEAFGRPDEGLLVDRLRTGGLIIVSLVAVHEAQVVGSVILSDVTIQTDGWSIAAVALAPLAVRPAHQRQGIGAALVRESLRLCTQHGKAAALVLGDPSYYRRFGFSSALAAPIKSPWSGPAWMALELIPEVLRDVKGSVAYPDAFQDV
ncbi:MAG: N-acetyltransferase [Candidatus Eremiobacteraeota bacterium]|nr:N-acetyltransferase [Candidatus Eremiobacteraeota bacterium]